MLCLHFQLLKRTHLMQVMAQWDCIIEGTMCLLFSSSPCRHCLSESLNHWVSGKWAQCKTQQTECHKDSYSGTFHTTLEGTVMATTETLQCHLGRLADRQCAALCPPDTVPWRERSQTQSGTSFRDKGEQCICNHSHSTWQALSGKRRLLNRSKSICLLLHGFIHY